MQLCCEAIMAITAGLTVIARSTASTGKYTEYGCAVFDGEARNLGV
jgi:hypothetical protein